MLCARSHSRPRAPGTDGPRPRIDNNVDRSARQNPGNQAPRSLASTRLAGIPEDLRQAALAVQKKRQEEAAALREAEAGAAAAGVIEAELVSLLAASEPRFSANAIALKDGKEGNPLFEHPEYCGMGPTTSSSPVYY